MRIPIDLLILAKGFCPCCYEKGKLAISALGETSYITTIVVIMEIGGYQVINTFQV